MNDMALLKARGISSGAYRKIFTAEPAEYPVKVKRLVDLISNRIRDGRTMNLTEWKSYAAIDLAYDVPFNQTTPTLLQNIMSQKLTPEQTVEALQAWGLKTEDLFLKVPLPDKGGYGLVPNPPVFFNIFIPLVKAYVTIRLAKIFNERNTEEFMVYHPIKETAKNQVLCEVMSDVSRTISGWYGYPSVLRQAIQQMLKYGITIAFTREEWHYEDELRFNPLTGRDEYATIKEGLRYMLPHPTRMFADQLYPLTSINTDTGCTFAGHWRVMRYGDILDDPGYWNRRAVFCGTNWFESPMAGNFFKEFYQGCVMKFPRVGWGPALREDKASWYTSNDRDMAVFVTTMFAKIVPKDFGLGEYVGGKLKSTYDRPIWHKFIVAGDDTVIWAEPCAYNPMWFMGYDYDEQAGRTSSMGLELIPWQDHVGNILTQILLTAQQNLANVTFYDENIVNKDDISRLQNLGGRMYQGLNFVGYDSTMNKTLGLDVKAAFIPAQLSKQNIQELFQVLPMVLTILERVIQVSAQEVGAAASHQQSKAEVVQTGGASTNRVIFTSSYVDEGVDAWMKQVHDGAQAYHDPQITASVSSDIEGLEGLIQELGFRITGRGRTTVVVAGDKKRVRLEEFATTGAGPEPSKEKEISQIVFQTVGTVASQPELFKKVGASNLLLLLETAAKMAGAPRDFKLPEVQGADQGEQVPANVMQAIQMAQKAVLQAVEEKIAKPVAKEVASTEVQIQQIEAMLQQLKGIYQVAAQTQDKNRIAAEKATSDQQRKDFQAQKAEQRKDLTLQRQIQREDVKAAADIKRAAEKSRVETIIKTTEAAHGAALEAHAAKATLAEQKKGES